MNDDRISYAPQHPLTTARRAMGLSVAQLARIAEFDPAVIAEIEKRRRHPTLAELDTLADVLRLRIVDLRE